MNEPTPSTDPSAQPVSDSLRDAQMSSWFVDPEGTALAREADGLPPMDADDFAEWLAQQTPQQLEELTASRDHRLNIQNLSHKAHDRLTKSVPELYQARLPAELETKLGGLPYALGFNQTMASTQDEATAYLQEARGIDYTGYNLSQRFLIYDQSMQDSGMLGPDNPSGIAGAIERGYTGNTRIGRFVAVFPEANPLPPRMETERLTYAVSMYEEILPANAVIQYTDNRGPRTAYSSKYVAGFIDGEGAFWANGNFAQSDLPDFRVIDSQDS